MKKSEKKHYLGLDIGSSGCKAVVFDDRGRQRASAYREYDVRFTEDGGAELDSDEVIERCFEVVRQCASGVEAGSVAALAVSSQGEAFTAVDDSGRALCRAMISSDTRAEACVEPALQALGREKLYRTTGHTAHPMFTLFKLLWFRENRADLWRRTRYFLCFEDLFHLRLGLKPAIGHSLAGRTMLFDVRRKKWAPEILALAGIRPEQLARPLASGKIAGYPSPEILARLGLSGRVAVVTGGHDQPCGALGAGAGGAEEAMYATGTVECIAPVFDKALFNERLMAANLCTYNHVLEDSYTTVAYSLTGGNILKWFRDVFGEKEKKIEASGGADAYEQLLGSMPDTPTPLLVLPYFTPSGTPYFDTRTPGVISGLRLSTTRGEIIRALLEGVTFEMRLNLEILEQAGCHPHTLRAIGGGARSAAWMQLKADVTGKRIVRMETTEAGCLGAAMLACSAVSGRPARELTALWVKPLETYKPNPQKTAFYDRQYIRYKKMYQSTKNFNI